MIGRSAGAFVLGAAGLLDGRPFTTHVEDADELERRTDGGTAPIAVRRVDDGDVITAGGMTSGIAAMLHLVERVAGRALADATAGRWTTCGHHIAGRRPMMDARDPSSALGQVAVRRRRGDAADGRAAPQVVDRLVGGSTLQPAGQQTQLAQVGAQPR